MKIALFSDFHANIDALKPVLKDMNDHLPDAFADMLRNGGWCEFEIWSKTRIL